MSILIKGMEMPFDGSFATIVIYPDGTVRTRRQDPLPYTAVSAADVAPVVHAHWTNKERYHGAIWGDCSNCGESSLADAYCSNCGARMDERSEDEV